MADGCDHNYTSSEIDNVLWWVCVKCGFGEAWEGGAWFRTTDPVESSRLDGLEDATRAHFSQAEAHNA